MSNKFTIWINDNVDLKGLGKVWKALGDIKSSAEKMHKSIKEGFENSKKAVEFFFLPLKAVAVPAIAGVTTAFGLAIKAVREFAGQELGEADVKSALIAMGQYTDQYRDRLIQLSDTYQTTTGLADDMWLKSLAQLTRFGMNASNVDKVAEALKNLTGLMDGNLDGATDMLAKAMQGEFGMFSRYGIIIEQTGDQIKDLDTAITAINSKGVGLLEARAETLAGKWNGLKTQVNETFEAVGKRLNEGLDIGAAVGTAKSKLATLTAAIQSGGIGDLIEKAADGFSKKIQDAVKWAEKIAEHIKNSGKPIEQVFSDALHAAAGVFWNALAAGVQASMAIWKAAGIAIFNAIEEQVLSSQWMQGTTTRMALKNFDSASPEQKAQWSEWRQQNPNSSPEQFKAHVASGNSDDEITRLIQTMSTDLKAIWTNLGAEMKATTEKAFGISPDGTSSAGKSTVTTTDASGNEVTMALEEYIAQLSAQNDKVAEAVDAGTDQAATTTETIEGATKAVEESTKQLEAVKTSHSTIETTMRSAATAANQSKAVALTTQQTLDNVTATLSLAVAQIGRNNSDIRSLAAQLRSMRA